MLREQNPLCVSALKLRHIIFHAALIHLLKILFSSLVLPVESTVFLCLTQRS